jgi:hypothetical protein
MMDPKAMMELSKLAQELPPSALSRLQTIMHNMMAGFDVKKELEDFEQSLPPGFREKMIKVMGSSGASMMSSFMPGAGLNPSPSVATSSPIAAPPVSVDSVKDARMTLLHAVASGDLNPDDAYGALFSQE